MFVVEALADFSQKTLLDQSQNQEKQEQKEENDEVSNQQKEKDQQKNEDTAKRNRSSSQQKKLQQCAQSSQKQQQQKEQKEAENQQSDIAYLSFQKGDKLLVRQTFENGWWYGHLLSSPQSLGFFPSNYVKTGVQPPPPKKNQKSEKEEENNQVFDSEKHMDPSNWVSDELNKVKAGPVKSDYYQGIKGYKMVKIDEKNQNILKGNHVQFDVSTGLARVPVKDQAPGAKAVRQMGYYFDYHQWNEGMNNQPQQKARPDIRKKKGKKLKLKMMD